MLWRERRERLESREKLSVILKGIGDAVGSCWGKLML